VRDFWTVAGRLRDPAYEVRFDAVNKLAFSNDKRAGRVLSSVAERTDEHLAANALCRVDGRPWLSFLTDLDAALDAPAILHCIGGFAMVHAYGLERATADIDILSVALQASRAGILEKAGRDRRCKKGMASTWRS
jgi:hypothetical protein